MMNLVSEYYPYFTNSTIIINILKQIIDVLEDEKIADTIIQLVVMRDLKNNKIERVDMHYAEEIRSFHDNVEESMEIS
jgi:hypothetical protein